MDGFLAAFPGEAGRAVGGAAAIRSATPAALSDLAPWRATVFARFAGLVVAGATHRDPEDQGRRNHALLGSVSGA